MRSAPPESKPHDPLVQDLEQLRAELAPIEEEAMELPWAHERPWSTASHLRLEGELIQVDLHDLNARCARKAVRAAGWLAGELDSGAVGFITGVGSHSIGPGVLGDVTARELRTLCKRHGWSFHPNGKGALILITDPERAPARATSQLPPLFWLIAAVFLGAVAYVAPITIVPMAILALVLLLRWWARRKERER